MTGRGRPDADAVIDEAIDRAVGGLMRVEPSADLHSRVLARLEIPGRPARRMPRLVAAAALAAGIVLAFVFTRDPGPSPPPAHISDAAPPPVPAVPPDPVSEFPLPADARRDDVRDGSRTAAARTATMQSADLILPTPAFMSTIAPLESIEPIVVASLQPPPLAANEIVIEPLAPIAALEIEPLFPSDGRN